MIRIDTVEKLREAVAGARARGATVALVPTMGALHEGHLSLIRHARGQGRLVVLSVFVNPAQFGPGEDLDRYPRDIDRDAALCEAHGVDVLFCPPVEEVYRPQARTWVTVEGITRGMCGQFRPGHFRGVATVVVKLLSMVGPDVAVFGRKDFQQLRVIESAVRDLDLPVLVEGAPTLRDPDGLAMSSRNAYLGPAERERALAIPRALGIACARWQAGERDPAILLEGLGEMIERAADRVDYFGLFDADDLVPLAPRAVLHGNPLLAVALHVGTTRLIDNVQLGVDLPPVTPSPEAAS